MTKVWGCACGPDGGAVCPRCGNAVRLEPSHELDCRACGWRSLRPLWELWGLLVAFGALAYGVLSFLWRLE